LSLTLYSLPLLIFLLVYLAMLLGRLPGLALDRTGAALLGAIVLLASGAISEEAARGALDVPTLGLLFGLMVVSAQLRMGGFYGAVTERLAAAPVSAPVLLALLIAVSGVLSALLCNDIVCLAMTPMLVEGCLRRRLHPLPFLLGLACSANIGSAATLIGNPQNMLIGQKLGLSFGGYLLDALPPVLLGLAACWGIIAGAWRGQWALPESMAEIARPLEAEHRNGDPAGARFARSGVNWWQSGKGLAILGVLVLAFLFSDVPRELLALAAAGLVLLSRRMHTRRMLALVDWHLLVLFCGLFIVNAALEESGATAQALAALEARGLNLAHPPLLFVAAVLLSNLVSNVPATMLLLPVATHPQAGAILALASTLAGNLLLVGSIANIIVAEEAQRHGVTMTWAQHARIGVPVALATLGLAAAWLLLAG
jgi:Na+/H+ antiporter NhaD/arsenite permease-like protein